MARSARRSGASVTFPSGSTQNRVTDRHPGNCRTVCPRSGDDTAKKRRGREWTGCVVDCYETDRRIEEFDACSHRRTPGCSAGTDCDISKP